MCPIPDVSRASKSKPRGGNLPVRASASRLSTFEGEGPRGNFAPASLGIAACELRKRGCERQFSFREARCRAFAGQSSACKVGNRCGQVCHLLRIRGLPSPMMKAHASVAGSVSESASKTGPRHRYRPRHRLERGSEGTGGCANPEHPYLLAHCQPRQPSAKGPSGQPAFCAARNTYRSTVGRFLAARANVLLCSVPLCLAGM